MIDDTDIIALTKWWCDTKQRHLWFSGMRSAKYSKFSNTDNIVFQKCQELNINLDKIVNMHIPNNLSINLCNAPSSTHVLELTVGYVVIMDQIVRHLIRHHNNNHDHNNHNYNRDYNESKDFIRFSNLAYQLANKSNVYTYEAIKHIHNCMGNTAVIFAVMPLRHVHHESIYVRAQMEKLALDIALHLITINKEKYKEKNKSENVHLDLASRAGSKPGSGIVKSFYQACLKQYCQTQIELMFSREECCILPSNSMPIDTDILDKNWCQDYNAMEPYQLYTQIHNVPRQFYQPIIDMLSNDLLVDHLIISVSGGVDSMMLLVSAICAIVHIWNNPQKYGNKKHQLYTRRRNVTISVVHINYGNRDTSITEEALVRRFVHEINTMQIISNMHLDIVPPPKFQVQLIVSRADEIVGKRDNAPYRDIYENITRSIRFATYHEAVSRHRLPHNNISEHSRVLLGHNSNDILENYLTNISNCKFNNIAGMNPEGEELGIKIWRPFLDISKTQIYNTAKLLGIPHVYDSTPKWCVRGKLRDNVIPVITTHLPGFINGINQLNKYIKRNASCQTEIKLAIKHRYISIHKVHKVYLYSNSNSVPILNTDMDNADALSAVTYMLDLHMIMKNDQSFMYDVLIYLSDKEKVAHPSHKSVNNMFTTFKGIIEKKANVTGGYGRNNFTCSINDYFSLELIPPYKLYAIFWPISFNNMDYIRKSNIKYNSK